MSVKKFKFVSPGVFLSEIDKSQIPATPGGVGPVIIGRSQRGPALKPVKVNSFQEFTEIFGEPIPGGRSPRGDVWRDGNGFIAPTYGAYAAQAYLKAKIDSPVTFIRLAGISGDDSSETGKAGWAARRAFGIWGTNIPVTPAETSTANCSLLGIIYSTGSAFVPGVNGVKADTETTEAGKDNLYNKANGEHVPVKIDAEGKFKILIKVDTGETIEKQVSFRAGEKHIRNVLNTNPVNTNTGVTSTGLQDYYNHYWLGETFEEEYENLVKTKVTTAGAATMESTCVFITRMDDAMADRKSDQHELEHSSAPWVIPQYNGTFGAAKATDLAAGAERLFRIHSIQEGEQSLDMYIEIQNIKIADPAAISPYGRFDVVVKQVVNDSIIVLDNFENLNLNPNSEDYIANRIGNQYFKWDIKQKRNRIYGDYANKSSFIRVEMNPSFAGKGPSDKTAVPFGYLGPVIPKKLSYSPADNGKVFKNTAGATPTWPIDSDAAEAEGVQFHVNLDTVVFNWPTPPTVQTGSTNPSQGNGEYVFGATPYNLSRDGDKYAQNFQSVNDGLRDYYRILADYSTLTAQQQSGLAGASTQHAYIFSLDDVVITGATDPGTDISSYDLDRAVWVSGSSQTAGDAPAPATNHSYTHNAARTGHTAAGLLDVVRSFALPLAGGSDGVNITEADPFNMSIRSNCVGPDATTANSYAYASIDRAIEMVKSPEMVEMKLATMPGISNKNLTAKLIQTCEARADALAIVDLPNIYKPESEAYAPNFESRVDGTTPSLSAKALIQRRINSSYGCAYYPWVQIRDTIDGSPVWVPPSVVALGAMAYTEQRDEVWFAPAGFNRGGLNEGNAGVPVLQVSEQLLSRDRDVLYDANINPIASFVSEGIVIFGQKTLQSTKSALDRINVRRLLIFVKKEVSRISNSLLFDNNLPATWNRFKSLVVPMLESVQTRLGLADFKVVLDETTTTPDLVDRNIMYAKIFLKPARAIEFIAVDFVITRSGASFDD